MSDTSWTNKTMRLRDDDGCHDNDGDGDDGDSDDGDSDDGGSSDGDGGGL